MASDRESSDPYRVLGVPRDADDETIKRSYRKAAQESHPDHNPDDLAAEERFKRVSAAYAVLSDADRRRDYDEFGAIALDPNFDATRAREGQRGFGGPGGGGFEFDRGGDPLGDLFSRLFGSDLQGGPRAPVRGPDLEATLEIDFTLAARGGEQSLQLDRPDASGIPRRESLTVTIPPGIRSGSRIRLAGKGGESPSGARPGDLVATLRVRPHPHFRRRGSDLLLDLPVTLSEAVLGAEVEVPTLDGRVKLRVPAGSDGGSRLRLRGKGVAASRGRPAGDLIATLRIRVPKGLDDAGRAAVAQLSSDEPDNPRAALFEP